MLKYGLSFLQSRKLQMAERIYGCYIHVIGRLLKKKPGHRHYAELWGFRWYCNFRTAFLIRCGGGKRLIPACSMVSTNGSIILDLDPYCPDGQSVHPDVIYDPARCCYMMAISAFPYKNDAYETPILLFSQDGTKWSWLGSAAVPVSPIPAHKLGYHSDPALLLRQNELYLFDRKVIIHRDGTAAISIDRYQWEQEWKYCGTVYSAAASWDNHELLLSPSMIDYLGSVHCWYCEKIYGRYEVRHLVFDGNWNVQFIESCEIKGLKASEYVWHLDICEGSGKLYMAADIKKDGQHSIWLMHSSDGGATWEKSTMLVSSGTGFSEKSVYRGSFVLKDSALTLYYSGRNNSEYWQTARIDFERIPQ